MCFILFVFCVKFRMCCFTSCEPYGWNKTINNQSIWVDYKSFTKNEETSRSKHLKGVLKKEGPRQVSRSPLPKLITVWRGVIGKNGGADVNKDNGKRLPQLCCNNTLWIMNTFFQHRDMQKHSWWRDFLGHRSHIDLFRSVLDVRVKRGAELSTNHHLVVCNLNLDGHPEPTETWRTRRFWRIK